MVQQGAYLSARGLHQSQSCENEQFSGQHVMKNAPQIKVQEVLTVVVLHSGRPAVKCHGVQPGFGTGRWDAWRPTWEEALAVVAGGSWPERGSGRLSQRWFPRPPFQVQFPPAINFGCLSGASEIPYYGTS